MNLDPKYVIEEWTDSPLVYGRDSHFVFEQSVQRYAVKKFTAQHNRVDFSRIANIVQRIGVEQY